MKRSNNEPQQIGADRLGMQVNGACMWTGTKMNRSQMAKMCMNEQTYIAVLLAVTTVTIDALSGHSGPGCYNRNSNPPDQPERCSEGTDSC